MKKPWTLRKRVFLSSVAIMGIVTFLLSVFNVMEIYLTERNTTAFETYMNLSTFFDSLSEAGGYLEEYLYTENEDSLTDYDEAIQTAEQSIENLDPAFLEDQMWHFQLLENMLYSYEDLGAELIADPLDDAMYAKTVNAQDLIQATSGDYYQRLTNRVEHHVEQLQLVNRAIVIGSLAVIAILLFWIIYVAFIMLRSFIRPLYEVLDNIEKINEGTYDFGAVAANGIEMQTLCQTLQTMADTVHQRIQETKEKAHLKQLLLEKENESLHKDELLAPQRIQDAAESDQSAFFVQHLEHDPSSVRMRRKRQGCGDRAEDEPAAALQPGQSESIQQHPQGAGGDPLLYRHSEAALR